MTLWLTMNFGSPQTGVGYRFQDNTGAWIGSRITTNIVALAESGKYGTVTNIPNGAVEVYWDCSNPIYYGSDSLTTRIITEDKTGYQLTSAYDAAKNSSSQTTLNSISAILAGAKQILLAEIFVPTFNPVVFIPIPSTSATTQFVFGGMKNGQGEYIFDQTFKFEMVSTTPLKSGTWILSKKPVVVKTDYNGLLPSGFSLERNDLAVGSESHWKVTNTDSGLYTTFILSDNPIDISNLIS